ncbi:HalD/BesD family halogenase [Salaquimonas pukyongi]|uniref:HalD/BesD family halogenase n=1 Tax=Salaquimonas pukyongi TaxID=2712698 RepID=UPI00096B8733|nr:hypothetical protein [Salaquimonas pukyongi]
MTQSAEELIDLERYPIDQPQSDGGKQLIAGMRSRLDVDGCAVLKGFVHADALAGLVAEADRAVPNAHMSKNRTNAYFTQDRPDLPQDHPVRRFYDRSNAFIPADNFGPGSGLRAIYEYPHFAPFIRQCLGEEAARFFPYADPLADVIVNMADAGNGFPWHFDTNNYTVTLALQNAEAGGEFEYAPNIRLNSDGGDENFSEVARVLDDQSKLVKTLVLEPGDLQIFKGRYSLHRVAPLKGNRRRYVAIFSYVEEPGMVGSVERTMQLYGKTLPIHHEREGKRADAYLD